VRLNSYLRRHSLPPAGVTQTCYPPPSVSLYGLSAALALRVWISVSIGALKIPGLAGTIPRIVPGFERVWTGIMGNVWETILIRKPIVGEHLVHAGNGWDDSMAERVSATFINLSG